MDNPEDLFAGKLEDNENFRCTPDFKTWLSVRAGDFDITKSDFLKEAVCFYDAMLRARPEIRLIHVSRLRKDTGFVRNILVLLDKV